ncbi:MAG: hypothetical protein ACM3OH_11565 [Bacillota bacterium]|jgi:hypothetical protein
MRIGGSRGWQWLAVAALAAGAPACVAAAAAGAGGALYVTSRGAESLVQGQPSEVAPRVTAAFSEFQIQQTGNSTENGGDKQEFKGTKGDLEVTVTLERKSPTTTNVEVTARKNLAEWDKDFAKQVLQKIVTTS